MGAPDRTFMNLDVEENATIIPAEAADLDRIVEIALASFTSPWTRQMFEVELSGNPFASLLTARIQKRALHDASRSAIAGYLCYWLVFEELRIMDVAVDPPARRRGLAGMLIRQALRSARESGARRAVLEVRESNVPARTLYERVGFRLVTRRTNYYNHPVEDAILMEMSPLVYS
jgi:ribosomal-protein-alanine N-acetyltransferase